MILARLSVKLKSIYDTGNQISFSYGKYVCDLSSWDYHGIHTLEAIFQKMTFMITSNVLIVSQTKDITLLIAGATNTACLPLAMAAFSTKWIFMGFNRLLCLRMPGHLTAFFLTDINIIIIGSALSYIKKRYINRSFLFSRYRHLLKCSVLDRSGMLHRQTDIAKDEPTLYSFRRVWLWSYSETSL